MAFSHDISNSLFFTTFMKHVFKGIHVPFPSLVLLPELQFLLKKHFAV